MEVCSQDQQQRRDNRNLKLDAANTVENSAFDSGYTLSTIGEQFPMARLIGSHWWL